MEKIDVAIQSYKKPESLVYTLLSLKKYCGDYIDTIYINDDCSGNNILDNYTNNELRNRMFPIKIETRENIKPSGYTHTIITKEMWKKRNIIEKIRLMGHFFIRRAEFYSSSDEVRYQWAINSTNKKYIFLIHDDIKFFKNVLELYINIMKKDSKMAIVGDLGGCKFCEFGPCGEKCSPEKILHGIYPCKEYPITGKRKNILLRMLGRKNRNCRINEWCCLINVEIARKLQENYGIYFGNYEWGGDVGTFWFEKIIRLGYHFTDPLPTNDKKREYYLHWWQGHEGHDVWIKKTEYQKMLIKDCLKREFDYNM